LTNFSRFSYLQSIKHHKEVIQSKKAMYTRKSVYIRCTDGAYWPFKSIFYGPDFIYSL